MAVLRPSDVQTKQTIREPWLSKRIVTPCVTSQVVTSIAGLGNQSELRFYYLALHNFPTGADILWRAIGITEPSRAWNANLTTNGEYRYAEVIAASDGHFSRFSFRLTPSILTNQERFDQMRLHIEDPFSDTAELQGKLGIKLEDNSNGMSTVLAAMVSSQSSRTVRDAAFSEVGIIPLEFDSSLRLIQSSNGK